MKGRKIDEAAIRQLDRDYRENAEGDMLVRAFNSLPVDDRALMLAYIECGNNAAELARMAGVSWTTMDNRLRKIKTMVKGKYQTLKAKDEDLL